KCLFASPIPQTGVSGIRHSTFESLRIGRSNSLNFKKDNEFMGITVLFLDEKMWLGKSSLSKALTLAKKQLELLSVSSLIRKK
ncbi:hypothetical protein HID58_034518, partial [Brassica napus]